MKKQILMPASFARKKQTVYIAPICLASFDINAETKEVISVELLDPPIDLNDSSTWTKIHEYDQKNFYWADCEKLTVIATELNSIIALEEIWFSTDNQDQVNGITLFYPDINVDQYLKQGVYKKCQPKDVNCEEA